MGVKPVIDIEVNDAEFQRFYSLFEAYSAELDDMPEAWRTLGAAMGESTKGFEAGSHSAKEALAIAAAQAGIIAEALRDATKAASGLDKTVDRGSKAMDKLRKGAEGVGKAISFVGGWILKLGALGGLGAIFSGFGIGDLAGAAFRRYRAASSLGLSPGLYSSFQVNAQQFLSTSALEAAANAQNDVSKAGYLAALGIRFNTARGMSATDLAFEELKAARSAYLQNPALAMQNPAIQSYLALGGNIGDVRNAATVPLSQLIAAQQRTRADAGMLGFSAQTAQAWSELKITLDKAGVSIETDLINKLGPLAPELTKLTQGVIDAVAAFVGGKNFDNVVADLKKGIGAVADFVAKTDWHKVGATITLVCSEIEAVAKKLSWLVPKKVNPNDDPFNPHAWTQTPGAKAVGSIIDWFKHAGKAVEGFMMAPFSPADLHGAASGAGRYVRNNPLDEKTLSGQWKQFATTDEGIRSNAKLLGYYYPKSGLDTLAKIIPTWAPASDGNDPNGYIAHVEKWSGVPRDLPMAKWTKAQFAAVISAMSRQEGTDPVTIGQVIKALYGAEVSKVQRAAAKAHSAGPQNTKTVLKRSQRQRPPVHVAVSNATSARVAVSLNAVAQS